MDDCRPMFNSVNGGTEAVVHVPTASGYCIISVLARPLQAGGRHALKLIHCNHARLRARVVEVIQAARLSEWFHRRPQWIDVDIDPAMDVDDRDWELGLVLADRLARGVISARSGMLFAIGSSSDWTHGRVRLETGSAARLRHLPEDSETGTVVLGSPEKGSLEAAEIGQRRSSRWHIIRHLGGLLGHPDPSQSARTARVEFPLVGGDPELAWVEVTAQPRLTHDEDSSKQDVPIVFNASVSASRQQTCIEILQAARQLDPGQGSGWRSMVRFSRDEFSDNSYELALVMADRWARGREVSPRGRLVATGCSNNWARGEIHTVQQLADKLALCQERLAAGDRLLLPRSAVIQSSQLQAQTESIRRAGVSVGLLDSISTFPATDQQGD